MTSIKLEELSLEQLIDLAKSRGAVDEVGVDGDTYRLEIGAGVFRLERSKARAFIEKLLRDRSSDVE